MLFRFPASDLDDADALLRAIGSFWSDTFTGNILVEELLTAIANNAQQETQITEELWAAVSCKKIHNFRKKLLTRIVLKESDMIEQQTALAYGDGLTHTGSHAYGGTHPEIKYQWPVPEALVSVPLITDRITNAVHTLCSGVDFRIVDHKLDFFVDPFTQFPVIGVLANNALVDREIILWLHGSQWDYRDVQQQYGYVFGLNGNSGENYEQIVTGVYDSATRGVSIRTIEAILSAITDTPIAKSDETVLQITTNDGSTTITTNKNTYKLSGTANVTIAVGDTLEPGDHLCDAFSVYDLTTTTPTAEQIQAITLSKRHLSAGFVGGITFDNATYPTTITTDDAGYTELRFPVGGYIEDIEAFWEEVHARGISSGKTLAMCLDTRTNQTNQPTASTLPATINPFEFLCKNILCNNFVAVKLKPTDFGKNAMSLSTINVLQNIIPPHIGVLLFVELATDESITMSESGTATNPGYAESSSAFTGLSASDSIDGSEITDTLRVRKNCTLC